MTLFYRAPKKQPESISVKLHHKIPAVSSKTSNVVTGMRKPEPQRNVLNAHLQPTITSQQNSATLAQPKVRALFDHLHLTE